MKIRIFGTIFLLVVLFGLYIAFGQDDTPKHNVPSAQQQQSDPNGLGALKIN